jgi:hypothetical protein
MDILRLARFKPSQFGNEGERPKFNELIARAARSWNPEYPGRKELPRKYAKICWATMVLAKSKQRDPQEMLPEVCRIKGLVESEVIEALESLASRIQETDHAFKDDRGVKGALISSTRGLLEKLR